MRATDAALSTAERVTFDWSMMPSATSRRCRQRRCVGSRGWPAVGDLVDYDGAVQAGVRGDPVERCSQGVSEDVDAESLIAGEVVAQRFQHRTGLNQRTTAAGHDALLDCAAFAAATASSTRCLRP